ncbi:hypothetical protein V6N11_005318 [Hibiscus sabdariffa]|uniref:tRNA N(3)-methylcytidine methyltransferase n=1 Tax=Hibiscus sabdariffa TaxID=183260 RepID=A0ABR2RMY7_9ROSI
MYVVPPAIAVNLFCCRWTESHRWIPSVAKYPKSDEYYQKNAGKFWDKFYKRHKNKFFKDRHYLEKDWGQYFSDHAHSASGKVVLEVGCGAGNTIFPLIAAYPKLYVQACDISPHAVALVKSHAEFNENRVNAFVCDVTVDSLLEQIEPSSVDVITLIFMLSAVSPYRMPWILQNVKSVLKPDGYVLLRDYAFGDFAQVKLENKNQMISDDFYAVMELTVDISTYRKQIKNCHKNITMDRRWIRAVFNNLD